MEVYQAVKIINECFAYKREHGELPVSPYDAINHYRRLAFKTIHELLPPKRQVMFKDENEIMCFDKNIPKQLGFFYSYKV